MHQNTYRAVVFDLDGTLLDTIEDIANSMNVALRGLGFPGHPVQDYLDYVGEGIEVMAVKALPETYRTGRYVAEAVRTMREEYAARWSLTSRPFRGIGEMLDRLVETGVRMSIMSNKLDPFTKAMAAKLLPDWSFDEVRGLSPDCPRKPDPEGAFRCARAMGASPEECIFVGDSAIDMQTAVRAGMAPFGVLWGYQDRARLLDGGARVLLSRPGDLMGYLPG